MITERIVVTETIATDNSTSESNFEANIVAIAAVGAQAEIAVDTNNEPLNPQTHIRQIIISGKITIRSIIANILAKLLKTFVILQFAKW